MNNLNSIGSKEIIELLEDFKALPDKYIIRYLEENIGYANGSAYLKNLVHNRIVTQDELGNCSLYGKPLGSIANTCIFHIALLLHKGGSTFHITPGKFPYDAISYADNTLFRYMICSKEGKGKLLYYKDSQEIIIDKDIQQIPVLIFIEEHHSSINELMYPDEPFLIFEIKYRANEISDIKFYKRGFDNE